MRNLPLPSPQSRRFFFFFAAALALPGFLHESFSTSFSVVIGVAPDVWPSLKMPP